MVVVSTRDFRTNQTKYLNLAKVGEHVVLKSRAGSFRIFPDDGNNTIDAPRDLMKELFISDYIFEDGYVFRIIMT